MPYISAQLSFFDEKIIFLKPRLSFGVASFELCHIIQNIFENRIIFQYNKRQAYDSQRIIF